MIEIAIYLTVAAAFMSAVTAIFTCATLLREVSSLKDHVNRKTIVDGRSPEGRP